MVKILNELIFDDIITELDKVSLTGEDFDCESIVVFIRLSLVIDDVPIVKKMAPVELDEFSNKGDVKAPKPVVVDSLSFVVSFNCSLVDVLSVVVGLIEDIVDVIVSVLFWIENKEVEDCNVRVVVIGFP